MSTSNKTPKIQKTTTNQINSGNVHFDKAIFIQNESGGYFNNGGFFTAFSAAIIEIAQNKGLTMMDVRLLILIIGYMGDKRMMIEPNRQRLLGVSDYAEELGFSRSNKGHISKSFIKLEEMGYFKRDKNRKELVIMINPALAYNGKTKDFTTVWNQLAVDFGNPERKQKIAEEDKDQDWNSDLERSLHEKGVKTKKPRTIRQHNIDGGIDEIECK